MTGFRVSLPLRWPRSLRSRLVLLVFSLIIPSFAAGGITLYQSYLHDREEGERHLAESARALSLIVDRQLGQADAALWAIASSLDVSREPAELDAQLRKAVRLPDSWVVLAEPGRQIVNTLLPPGALLPAMTRNDGWQERSSDKSTIAPLFTSVSTQEPAMSVSLVLEPKPGRRLLLAVTMPPKAFGRILADQQLPQGWIATIIDSNGKIVARSQDSEAFEAKDAEPEVLQRVKAGVDTEVFGSTAETPETLTALNRSNTSGWTITLAVPTVSVVGAAKQSALSLLGLGTAILAAGSFLAFALARSVARPVEDLAKAARALGAGRDPGRSITDFDFRETAAVRQAISLAGQTLQERAAERDKAEAALRKLNETLEERVIARTSELAKTNDRLVDEMDERRRAEARLSQAQRLEAVGQLTGGLAHDFNNLLTAILGSLDLIRVRVGGTDPAVAKLLDIAMSGAQRGARLTTQLLAFSRKQFLDPKPIDANGSVQAMVGLLKSTLGGTIRIETNATSGLWTAIADPTQIELVILNLALNARDAMPQGGTLTISTSNVMLTEQERPEAPPAGAYVMVEVSDTGTGIPPEVIGRVFEPFFTTKGVGKGSGLGLSQVLGIAKQLGGGVIIESTPGKGTCVRVYLPRARQQQVASAETPAEQRTDPGDSLAGLRILVVDDDDDVRRTVAGMLVAAGCVVREAASGLEGLAAVEGRAGERGPPDLVLIDHAMPGMTGSEAAERMRRIAPRLRIILMTGYADRQDLAGALEPMLTKPFRAEELWARVADTLGRRDAGGKTAPRKEAV